MPAPRAVALALAASYRLALDIRPPSGLAGAELGRSAGGSLEFQDRRAYVPGDDVRHLDWGAYARTDQLFVRLYREEVAPMLDLVLDRSLSMGTDQGKLELAVDLAGVLGGAARAIGAHVRVIFLGDKPEVSEWQALEAVGFEATHVGPLMDSLRGLEAALRAGSTRVLLSDFLSPHDPGVLVRSLAMRSGGIGLVQVLSEEDADPVEDEAVRLVDSETGESVDLVLDSATVDRYRTRLHRLQTDLAEAVRGRGGVFSILDTSKTVDLHCRETLVRDGFLVPA